MLAKYYFKIKYIKGTDKARVNAFNKKSRVIKKRQKS